jgi:hypothetical protein
VRAIHSNPTTERCKSRKPAPPEIPADVASPPRRSIPPTSSEKASRIAELRVVLADAAPLFQARIRRDQEGGRS